MSIIIPILTELKSEGIDKAITQFKSLETNGQKAQFAVQKAAIPATAALVGLGAALGDAVKAASEDEAAQRQLFVALRNNTGATKEEVAQTEKWISAQGKVLGVADDQLRPALQKLTQQTHDIKKAQELASLAMDISASTGKDLASVTTILAKAQGGQVSALAKLDPQMKSAIKDGMSLDDAMSALSMTFDGAAATAAGSAQGQMKKFSLALQETKESIGAALLPVLKRFMDMLLPLGAWAQEHTSVFLVFAGVVGGIAAAVLAVNTAMKIYEAYTKLSAAATWLWNAALDANPIGLIVIGIAALVAGVVLAYKHFEGFRNVINTIGLAIKTGFLVYFTIIKTEVEALYGIFKFVFNGIADLWNNSIGKVKIHIPDIPGLPGRGETFGVPNIPKLANGGIVTSPTLALIGERGPEAVVPLNRAGGMGANVTINVNGGDPNAIVSALRTYMRQNGSVPIRVSNIY